MVICTIKQLLWNSYKFLIWFQKSPSFLDITALFMVTSALQVINTTQSDFVWALIHDEQSLYHLLKDGPNLLSIKSQSCLKVKFQFIIRNYYVAITVVL